MLFLTSLCIFLWKYAAYEIIDMVNKFAAPKCQTGYTSSTQFVIFKPLSYCFEETIVFDVKASFASRPLSRLIR